MAITVEWNEVFISELFDATHDITGVGAVKAILTDGLESGGANPFDASSDNAYSDISAQEISAGNGYLQNTAVLAGVSIEIVSNEIVLSATNQTWTASGGAIAGTTGMILYMEDAGVTDRVLCYIDFDATYTALTGTNLVVNLADGFVKAVPNP